MTVKKGTNMENRVFNIITKIIEKMRSISKGTPEIQCGRITGTSVSANTYLDRSFTFPKQFENIPVVTACFISTSVAPTFGRCTIAVNSITAKGATIRIFNSDTVGRVPDMFWIAIGEKNG